MFREKVFGLFSELGGSPECCAIHSKVQNKLGFIIIKLQPEFL